VPLGTESLTWEVTAKEKNGTASDRLKITQKIVEAVQARVFQATITQVDKPYKLAVEKPKDALPGKGGVNVSFRKKLSNGLGGVTWYMKQYPYTCMEQRTSRHCSSRRIALEQVIADLPAHMDGDGLASTSPLHLGSDTLSIHAFHIERSRLGYPEDSKERMLTGRAGLSKAR
jgi:hypothetical protein